MISESEMNRMQQEAARRASEMHNRTARPIPPQSKPPQQPKPPPPKPEPPPQPDPPVPSIPCPPVTNSNSGDILEVLMHDKERNLILLMIILLMGEDCDHTILLALLYLLI